jgi:hypothetical protein
MMDLQLCFDQLLTWPTDQPRHATTTLSNPVEADRPRFGVLLRTQPLAVPATQLHILSSGEVQKNRGKGVVNDRNSMSHQNAADRRDVRNSAEKRMTQMRTDG